MDRILVSPRLVFQENEIVSTRLVSFRLVHRPLDDSGHETCPNLSKIDMIRHLQITGTWDENELGEERSNSRSFLQK